jgi:hypothetical protein
MIEENEKEGEGVAVGAARRDGPPHVKCGRGHRHRSAAEVTECDYRLAMRAQRKLDETRGAR